MTFSNLVTETREEAVWPPPRVCPQREGCAGWDASLALRPRGWPEPPLATKDGDVVAGLLASAAGLHTRGRKQAWGPGSRDGAVPGDS